MNRQIAVVEPQMEGFFHAPFNAALLHAIVLAYPEVKVSFRSFPSHAEVVRDILEQHAPGLAATIEWRTDTSARAHSLIARWRQSARVIREVLAPGERVLFTSISRMALLQLKRTLRGRSKYNDRVCAVLHGDLDRIEVPSTERFPMRLFALDRVLLQPHPKSLRYLLLSRSILENIPPRFQQAMANSSAIDHPYHFFPIKPQSFPPVFGILGTTGEGKLFEQVTRMVKTIDASIRFRLVGFVLDQAAVERLQPYVEDIDVKPISREAFIERATSLTHTLWLAPPNGFRLRASGTFLDALSYAKPLIYTANPFIDPYFAEEPGIGIRCESVDQVPMAVLKAASASPEAYLASVAAIERFRVRFTPEHIAKTLPEALAWD